MCLFISYELFSSHLWRKIWGKLSKNKIHFRRHRYLHHLSQGQGPLPTVQDPVLHLRRKARHEAARHVRHPPLLPAPLRTPLPTQACLLYLVSFHDPANNWTLKVGGGPPHGLERYFYAFYFASTTMLTIGYGDLSPANSVEVLAVLPVQVIGTYLPTQASRSSR